MINDRDPARQSCGHCGKVLGSYEPLMLIGQDGQATRTSLLHHPVIPPAGVMLHEGCFKPQEARSEERTG
jgi:hypothetical protein